MFTGRCTIYAENMKVLPSRQNAHSSAGPLTPWLPNRAASFHFPRCGCWWRALVHHTLKTAPTNRSGAILLGAGKSDQRELLLAGRRRRGLGLAEAGCLDSRRLDPRSLDSRRDGEGRPGNPPHTGAWTKDPTTC